MSVFTVQNLDHVVLRVTDMEKSLNFYIDVLGLDIAKTNEYYSMVHLRAGTSMIDLIDVNGRLGKPGGEAAKDTGRNVDHICLRVEPFNETAIIDYFAKHGMAVDKAGTRYGAQGEGLSVYCYDPDGNKVEL